MALNHDETPRRAQTVTASVARRLPALRKAVGMTQAELGAAMAEHRPGWSRSTVVKLERLQRETLPIDDLLPLALVLGVSPVWLLADPASNSDTRITDNIEQDPWGALLWMTGLQMPHDRVPYKVTRAWDSAEKATKMVNEIVDAYERMARIAGERDMQEIIEVPDWSEEESEAKELKNLDAIAKRFRWLLNHGFVVPPVPEHLAERAQALNVQLPTAAGDPKD